MAKLEIEVLKKQTVAAAEAKGHKFGLFKNDADSKVKGIPSRTANVCTECGATINIDVEKAHKTDEKGTIVLDERFWGTALTADCSEEARAAYAASKPAKPTKPAGKSAGSVGASVSEPATVTASAVKANKTKGKSGGEATVDPTTEATSSTESSVPSATASDQTTSNGAASSASTEDTPSVTSATKASSRKGGKNASPTSSSESPSGSEPSKATTVSESSPGIEVGPDEASEPTSDSPSAENPFRSGDKVKVGGQPGIVDRVEGDIVHYALVGFPGEYSAPFGKVAKRSGNGSAATSLQ